MFYFSIINRTLNMASHVTKVESMGNDDADTAVNKTSNVSRISEKNENKDEKFTTVLSRNRKRKFNPALKTKESTDKGDMDTSENESQIKRPMLPPISSERLMEDKSQLRKVPVPPHRFTPLKDQWMKIFTPIVEHLHLQIRFNLKTRNVELKTCKETKEISAIQKGADFVRAFTLGFDVDDALALVRLDDLYLDSFQIQDVKPLKGDHLARAIGRIAGKNGTTKYTIENVTRTRIVLADSKIHLLGSYQNTKIARTAICNLILGSPPSKVYGNMRQFAARASERF